MTNERKAAGANYIISFYNDIQLLNYTFAQYYNLIIELETKEKEKLEDSTSNIIMQTAQNVRHYCHLVFIKYQSIIKATKLDEDNDVKESYDKIKTKDNFIIPRDVLENFVIAVNASLVNDVIKDLLVTSQDVYNDIYGNSTE